MLCPEQILKTIAVVVMLTGIIPLLLSLLVKLVIEVPLRVPVDQTPFYAWQVGKLQVMCIDFHHLIFFSSVRNLKFIHTGLK